MNFRVHQFVQSLERIDLLYRYKYFKNDSVHRRPRLCALKSLILTFYRSASHWVILRDESFSVIEQVLQFYESHRCTLHKLQHYIKKV